MKNLTSSPLRWTLIATALSAQGLFAQTAPAPTPAPSSTEASDLSDEIIVLPEFSVSSTKSNDYVAAESLTGTRIATKIRDLPFNVNSVTGEFIDDFAAFELPEQFAYVSSVSPSEVQGQSQIRGFETNNQLRNGFRRLGLIDKVSVDRAEVIKGPAASIYGKIQPGGIINIITKKPGAKPQQELEVGYGSNEQYRAEISSTGPLPIFGKESKLYYRVDLAYNERRFDQRFKKQDGWTSAAQLAWKPDLKTTVSFEVEYLDRNEVRGNGVPTLFIANQIDPFRLPTSSSRYSQFVGLATQENAKALVNSIYDSGSNIAGVANRDDILSKLDVDLFNFNTQGPREFNDREVFTLTGSFERRLSQFMSLRIGANWFDRGFGRASISGSDVLRLDNLTAGLPDPAIGNGTGNNARQGVWSPTDEGGSSVQADLLTSFNTGKIKHRLLFTLDYNRVTRDDFEARDATRNFTTAGLANTGVVADRLSINNPDYRFTTYADDPSLYTDIRENVYAELDNYGVFVSERAIMFNDKLNLMAGGRYDEVDNNFNNRRLGQFIASSAKKLTYQLGLNYRVVDGVNLYANKSTSFSPQNQTDDDGTPLQPETATGYEAGVKLTFWDERLNITTGVYSIERRNIARQTTDPLTSAVTFVVSGLEESKGAEIDWSYVITPGLQFFGGYGYADTEIVSHDELSFLVGNTPRRVPSHNLGAGLRYEFKDGRLKGLYVTAATQYYSSSVVLAPNGRTFSRITGSGAPNSGTGAGAVTNLNPVVNARMPNGQLPFPTLAENALLTTQTPPVGDSRYVEWTANLGDTVRVSDGREFIKNAEYWKFDASVGYKFKTAGRYRHKVQVNFKNITDEVYTFGGSIQGDPFTTIAGYTLTF